MGAVGVKVATVVKAALQEGLPTGFWWQTAGSMRSRAMNSISTALAVAEPAERVVRVVQGGNPDTAGHPVRTVHR